MFRFFKKRRPAEGFSIQDAMKARLAAQVTERSTREQTVTRCKVMLEKIEASRVAVLDDMARIEVELEHLSGNEAPIMLRRAKLHAKTKWCRQALAKLDVEDAGIRERLRALGKEEIRG